MKAERRAVYYLTRYADSHDEADFQQFRRYIAVPLSDGLARVELEQPEGDRERMRQFLLQGGNHPEDIDNLIWLFRTFRWVPEFERARQAWEHADRHVRAVDSLGWAVHDLVTAPGPPDATALDALMAVVYRETEQVAEAADAFSMAMGAAARRVYRVLRWGMPLAGVAFLFLVAVPIGRVLRRLKASEIHYRELFESANDAILLLDPATEDVLAANERAAELYGLPREVLVGTNLKRLSADVEQGEAYIRELLQGRRIEFETEQRQADGTHIHIRLSASLLNINGEAVILSHNRNITRQKQAEAALRDSEARYRSVVESVRDVVFQTNSETQWTFLNPAWERVSGFSVAESLGRSCFDFIHPDDRARQVHAFKALFREDIPFLRFESRYRFKDGGFRNVEVHAQLLRDDSTVIGTTGSITDITDTVRFAAEHEARERAEEMLRLKESFLNNMSHELRTPLVSILGFAEILAEEVPEELRDEIAAIRRSGERLRDTLNAVLDLAQLEAGEIQFQPALIHVATEARTVMRLLAPRAEEKGVEFDIQGDEVHAVLDRMALQRILMNLLSNAVKFTNDGRVAVTVAEAEEHVTIRIADTGIGINAKFLPHLFDEFKQESTGLARRHEGSGLGLAITKHLVDLMEGTITAESEVGIGSTFIVRLPIGFVEADSSVEAAGTGDGAVSDREHGRPAVADPTG